MCQDYYDACDQDVLNCSFLPFSNDSIPCNDQKVICSSPHPSVENGTVSLNYKTERIYKVEFTCDEGFRMEGNRAISCVLSGKWSSKLPVCLPIAAPAPRSESWFLVLTIVFILYIVGMVVIIVTVIYRIRLKATEENQLETEQVQIDIELKEIDDPLMLYRKRRDPPKTDSPVKRNREFDAFVLYHFDSDDTFVVETLLPELEENRDFRLCMHSRDFTPGRDIKDNIEEAIEASNSAIIVLSQGFVDSMWC